MFLSTGLDLPLLVSQFLEEKDTLIRGLTHPFIFQDQIGQPTPQQTASGDNEGVGETETSTETRAAPRAGGAGGGVDRSALARSNAATRELFTTFGAVKVSPMSIYQVRASIHSLSPSEWISLRVFPLWVVLFQTCLSPLGHYCFEFDLHVCVTFVCPPYHYAFCITNLNIYQKLETVTSTCVLLHTIPPLLLNGSYFAYWASYASSANASAFVASAAASS